MASFKILCDRVGLNFDDYWREDSETELHHFIGKDIAYFHTLFWPAMLDGARFRKPTSVYCHGFLTVQGQKMSKSRGTFIMARTYLEHVKNPEYLRYYFAAKLGAGVEDIDLSFDDFITRVNSDLVGKVINIASRSSGFINKRFEGKLASPDITADLARHFGSAAKDIAGYYEGREYGRALRRIMQLADLANQYVDANKPWELAQQADRSTELHAVCSTALTLFRDLMLYLSPVLPATAERARMFLNVAEFRWQDAWRHLPAGHRISAYEHLMTRIEPRVIDAMVEASKQSDGGAAINEAMNEAMNETINDNAQAASAIDPIAPEIDYEDFAKLDLRLGEIVQAQPVPGADKLLELRINLGSERRTVFAGIKAAYTPEQLIGRLTIVVANLKPRKMRFGVSEGMVLAAGPGGKDIFLLKPDAGARQGMRVK